ncbi:hypothetical protein EJB05_13533, partial [Eragrostis curvula]
MASWCSRRSKPGGYGAQSSASNDGVFLPSELLREILLRVPSAKTICRLRAVCRSWRSLLSDPLFVAAHGASHPGPLFAVFVIRSRSSPGSRNSCIDLMDTSGDVVKRVRVAGGLSFKSRVQQRAGMVLIADHETERLRVLDPATGAVSILPSARYDSAVLGRSAATAAGGGGDGEYKVVVLTGTARPRTAQSCKVFTLGNGAWREAPIPPVHVTQFSRSAAVVKGVVYYLADLTSDRPWSSIAAFHLEAERWLPGLLRSPGATVPHSLAEVDGHLAAIYHSVFSVDLWLLMGSGEDGRQALWCKRFTVLRSRIAPQSWQRFSAQLLWVMDDGRVAFFVNSSIQAAALGMYDPRTETWTEFAQLEDCIELLGAGVYTGNLLRVQREQAMDEPSIFCLSADSS